MKAVQNLLAFAAFGAALTALDTAFGADAATNWKEHCAKCHGDTGKGDTKTGRKLAVADLTDGAVQAKFTDADAFKAMKEGLKDKNDKVTMKPVENMSDDDIRALVAHVRTLKK